MKLLILGMARHGKDTVSEILRDDFGLSFQSSSMFAAEHVVQPAMVEYLNISYDTLEDCYEDRVNHRAFWYDAISAYNEVDKARLAREILSKYDMYVGMRSAREYEAALPLFDAVAWVDASRRGLPPEPASSMSIQFDPDSMTVIDNGGTLADLRQQVAQFVQTLKGI